jgi:cold shock CspA family protein
MQVRETGIINKYLNERGFGFIGREGCADLFFHCRQCEMDGGLIREGMHVEFEVGLDVRSGRPQAANVTLAEGGN